MNKNKKELKERLKSYLECESILNQVFERINYCAENCRLMKEKDTNIGCCGNMFDFYEYFNGEDKSPRLAFLVKDRIKIYGKPNKTEDKCGYHSDSGCILKSHKSPICVTHCCSELKKYMGNKYSVIYHEDYISDCFAKIVIGDFDNEFIEKFKKELEDILGEVSV
ncbi:MAG: hypothetical protein PHW96_04245 [Candidatus Nanoarchaeia archaeon]|nr:hypothetical protein [Candidatus Nanoarchaeia archaeon]